MKINGWDILEASARQLNVTPGFHSIKNDSDWVRGSPTPVVFANEIGFKPLQVTILIKADRDRQAILDNCSLILSKLLEPVNLELDDFEHKFYGVLAKYSLEENPLNVPFVKYNRASKLILEFDGYEYASEVIQSTSGSTTVTITNPGNIITPAVIEIAPQIGAAEVVLTGICCNPFTGEDLPVKINDLVAGSTVILDGETGLFTQSGELKEVEIWGLPVLLPGENKITVNNNRMDISVRFRPRFM